MSEVSRDDLLQEARITRVLIRYATLLDERNWEGLDEVFTTDAIADYRGIGSFSGLRAITDVVRGFLDACGPTQHMISNIRITLEGSEANAKCYLQATHSGRSVHEGKTMTVWGEYNDKLKRGREGWRIVHRELVVQHVAGDVGVALKGKG